MIFKNVKAKESLAYQEEKKQTENRYTAQVKGVRD